MENKRRVRRTIFIYCEGKTDHLFVKFLKSMYWDYRNKVVKPKQGSGGGPKTFFIEVLKNAQVRNYDEKYIVLDSNSKGEEEKSKIQKKGKDSHIELIWQRPCLEGVLLRILNGNQFINMSSRQCKSQFKREYLSKNTSFSESLLKKLFTKEVLDKKRQEVQELNRLIQVME